MTSSSGRRPARLRGFAAFSVSVQPLRPSSELAATQTERLAFMDALMTPLFSGLYLFAALVCLGYAQPFLSVYFLAAWAMTSPYLIVNGLSRISHQLRKHHLRAGSVFGLVVGLTAGLVLSSALFSPAHAQFLQSAEQAATDLTSGLGGGNTDISPVIEFIVGALRLLLIVYMAVALIQIVNAARQGEEWKDLVRTPLLVILVVIIGDFIANIIVGGGGGAGAV